MKKKRRKNEAAGRKEAEGLEQLPLHVVAQCLCDVFVKAREKSGLQRQDIARRLGKHPPHITKIEQEDRHLPAMELPRLSAGYGLTFMEVIEGWVERMKRAYEEMRKGRRAAGGATEARGKACRYWRFPNLGNGV